MCLPQHWTLGWYAFLRFRNHTIPHIHHYTAEEPNRHNRRLHSNHSNLQKGESSSVTNRRHKNIPISTKNGFSDSNLKHSLVPSLDQKLSNSTDGARFIFESFSSSRVSKQEDNISTTSLPSTPTAAIHNSKVLQIKMNWLVHCYIIKYIKNRVSNYTVIILI